MVDFEVDIEIHAQSIYNKEFDKGIVFYFTLLYFLLVTFCLALEDDVGGHSRVVGSQGSNPLRVYLCITSECVVAYGLLA